MVYITTKLPFSVLVVSLAKSKRRNFHASYLPHTLKLLSFAISPSLTTSWLFNRPVWDGLPGFQGFQFSLHYHSIFSHTIMAVVAVAGGTGGVGRTVLDAIAKSGRHKAIVLSRGVR